MTRRGMWQRLVTAWWFWRHGLPWRVAWWLTAPHVQHWRW
jgi:hypothetical protein